MASPILVSSPFCQYYLLTLPGVLSTLPGGGLGFMGGGGVRGGCLRGGGGGWFGRGGALAKHSPDEIGKP